MKGGGGEVAAGPPRGADGAVWEGGRRQVATGPGCNAGQRVEKQCWGGGESPSPQAGHQAPSPAIVAWQWREAEEKGGERTGDALRTERRRQRVKGLLVPPEGAASGQAVPHLCEGRQEIAILQDR